jgi:outer membrane protein TolC
MLIDGENFAIGELFSRFYNVLLQQGRIMAEESAVQTSVLHLKEVEKMSELGLANKLEVIRARQQLATNTANLSTAQGLYEASHLALMNYMAIPPEARRPVVGTLQMFTPKGSREESLALAMANRADFAQLQEQLKYQENQIEVEKSGRRPKVALGASTGYLNPYLNRDRGSDTWRAELSIAVPIFDRNVTRGNVIRERATLEQDKIALAQKELDIKSGVETAWTELETTLRHLESTKQALGLAEESLRLAEIGFQEGVTPQLDLLTAQTALTQARLDHLSSLYNHVIAVTALKTTEGDIISWTEERDF